MTEMSQSTSEEKTAEGPSPSAEGAEVDSLQTSPMLFRYARRKSSAAILAVERLARTRQRLWSTAVSAVISSLSILLAGFTLVYSSPALLELGELSDSRKFNTVLLSLFVALAFIAAVFGGPVAGWISDRWGRKVSIFLSGFPYIIGYLFIVIGHFVPNDIVFKSFVLIGRTVTGFGLGWSSVCVPVVFKSFVLFGRTITGFGVGWSSVPIYIGEMASAKVRGVFNTFVELFLSFGVLLVFSVSAIPGLTYYYVAIVAVGVALLFELLALLLHETPRWLLNKGKKERAIAVLEWLRGPKVSIAEELQEIEDATLEKKPSYFQTLKMFLKPSLLHPLILVLVYGFFFQLSGLAALSAFSGPLFVEAGISNPNLASACSVGIASCVGVIISIPVVDLVGRKVLLIVGGIGMLFSTVMLGTQLYLTRPSLCVNETNLTREIITEMNSTLEPINMNSTTVVLSCNSYIPLAIVAVILFFLCFPMSWGPIQWLFNSELFPSHVRGVAGGIGIAVFWGLNAIIVGFYLEYEEAVRPWFAVWSFSIMMLLGLVFVIVFIPETKGKSLEDIQKKFERKEENTSFIHSVTML